MANPNPNMSGLTPFTTETAPRRKNAGLSINEWRNTMSDWSRADIEAIIADPKSKAAQIIAARECLAAMEGGLDAIRQVCDYSGNKPKNHNEISGDLTIKIEGYEPDVAG